MTDERVLVVSRNTVFPAQTQQGFISDDVGAYLHRMQASYAFKARRLVENDPSLKQIIPYVVFMHEDRVFLVKRLPAQSEQRLAGMFSIGIGGHINKGDATGENHTIGSDTAESFHSVLVEGMNREIREEVFVREEPQLSLAGLINDDSTPVGQVHLGLVYLARLSEPCVTVRETELMAGNFVLASSLDQYYPAMETWSQIVLESGCLRLQGRG